MRKHALSSPKTGIDHRTPVINKRLANLSSEVNVSAKVETVQTQDYGYNAQYQALQAKQLGKLASAINELNEKNWNIQVNVRNTGSTAYFDSLNRIM
jgi:hypothetical protein